MTGLTITLRWSEGAGLETVRDVPLDPVNLAVDASGKLLVLSSLGAEAITPFPARNETM